MDEAVAAVGYAEALAAELAEPELMGSILMHRSMMASRRGHHAVAEQDARAALPLLTDHPDATHAHTILGVCAIESDRFAEAEQHHLMAAEVARRHHYDHALAIALHNLAHVNLWRGRFDLALRYAGEANTIQISLDTVPHTWPLHAVQVFQIRSQRAEAWEAHRLMADLAVRMPLYEVFVAIFAARLHLDEQDFPAAQAAAERAYSLAVRVGIPAGDVMARTVNSRLHRLMGNPIRAIEWAKDALTHARRVGYGYMEAHALIEEGAAHRENGNPDAAAACWEQALQIARSLGARHEEAHAQLLLASLYHAVGHAEAGAHWRLASLCILEHGYTFLLERERATAFPVVAAYARSKEPELRQPAELLLGRLIGVAAVPLHIGLLGDFTVQRGAHGIDSKALQRRRAGELMRFLLMQPGLRAQREVVLETLWPDQAPGKGQGLLHQATSTLRRALEADLPDKFPSRYLLVEGEWLTLHLPPGSTVDFREFRDLLAEPTPSPERLNAAIALYRGDLFAEDRDADWAERLREELAEQYHRALATRALARLQADDAEAALRDCRTLLDRDACHEDAALIAMRAHLRLGNHPAALRLYHRLERALEREFQLSPREDLMALAATLRRHRRTDQPH
jgi:DNA-binding SARP family transcriptional activator